MFIINFFVISGIKDIIDFMSCYQCLKFCNRENYPGIYLTWVHNNRPIEMSECIAGLQIIKAQKSSYFSTKTQWAAIFSKFNRAHIICYNSHFTDMFFTKYPKCLK